ncbi:hypothetical protein [Endozoicomonas montiporae]|nr:hypothetical protein [Endozoicomonas montiporae]
MSEQEYNLIKRTRLIDIKTLPTDLLYRYMMTMPEFSRIALMKVLLKT